MAQEDKGLILRGFFLLALIGALVTFVLALIFWRTQPITQTAETQPEYFIAPLAAPGCLGFPSHVPWPTVFQLSEKLPSEPGWDVRYNAAATLARRGSVQVPWPLIREMLDEKQQLRNQRIRMPDGKEVYDEVAARAFTSIALKAVATWHSQRPPVIAGIAATAAVMPPSLQTVYARVDLLAQSPHKEVQEQAEKTRATLFRQ